jgi:hypothetical protein
MCFKGYFFLMEWDWVHLVLWPLFGLLYQPQMLHDYERGAVGGMWIGRGNRSTRRKPAPVPFCPPQIPHDPTRARIWAAAVGAWWLTAWAMARPCFNRVNTLTDPFPVSELLHASYLPILLFDSEDGGNMFHRSVGWVSTDYIALYPRRQKSSFLFFFLL